MFTPLLKTDFYENVIKSANIIIEEDRLRYIKIYELIEEFCKLNNMIISSVDKIIDPTVNIYEYVLFCDNPLDLSQKLANEVYHKIGDWVKMRTVIPYQEFTVEYDLRKMASIYRLTDTKKISSNIIKPININGLKYLPPGLELIDIYNKLYS